MKKVLSFVAVAAVLFTACKKETPNTGALAGKQIVLTANMPADSENRVALTEDAGNIVVKWQVGDIINLYFVQEGIKKTGTTTISAISNDGKTGTFILTLPNGISTNAAYSLYGVYGGEGFVAADNGIVKAPYPNNNGTTTLATIQSKKMLMMNFTANVPAGESNINATFKHLGAIVSLYIKNTTSSNINVDEIKLGSDTGADFLYATHVDMDTSTFAITGSAQYDLAAGKIVAGKEYAGKSISYYPAEDPTEYTMQLKANAVTKLSNWVMPSGILSSALPLSVIVSAAGENGTPITTTTSTSLPAKMLETGKHYVIYATFDKTTLTLTKNDYITPR